MLEFHTEAPQATVSEGLAQGPYMAASVVVEPVTLWTKGVDSSNAPHHAPQLPIIGLTLVAEYKCKYM